VSRFDVRHLRSREELLGASRELTTELRNDDVPSMAAAVAFKIILALFPSLVAAIAVFSLVTDPSELRNLLNSVRGAAPNAVDFLADPLDRLIRGRAAGLAAVVGVAGGLWVSSSAAVTLNRSLSRAYDLVDTRRFVKGRAAALAVTVALLFALVAIFVLLVLGDRIENAVLESLPLTTTAANTIDVVVTVLRNVLAAGVLMLLFAFIYWVGPDFRQRQPYPWMSPGAVLGVVLWLTASGLFSLYVNTFGSYTDSGSVYGSLGNAIVFMLWLQMSMLALLAGAEVNQVLQLRATKRSATAEIAGFGGEPAPPLTSATGSLDGGAVPPGAPPPATPVAPAGVGARVTNDRAGDDGSVSQLDGLEADRAVNGRGSDAREGDEHSSGWPAGGVAAGAFAVVSGVLGLIGLLRNRRRE
jgi:membrane protein